ncbi:hypothetical protein HI113_10460 [Corallococcus exiguus]|uniref:hypothetical protein n=1 Tax=Corallococcus exiguus TaxID=83462 RepID=UPI001475C278|nr:hypothetical protein [Corallococcus exiguus]NNB94327.1 hypothetical protein [Corallococcus exiguus]
MVKHTGLVAGLLLFSGSSGHAAPTFRPAEVKKNCGALRENAESFSQANLLVSVLKNSSSESLDAVLAADYVTAREAKSRFTMTMKRASDAFDRLIESLIYFRQLVDHLKALPSLEQEKLKAAMEDCQKAMLMLGDLRQGQQDDPESAESAGDSNTPSPAE